MTCSIRQASSAAVFESTPRYSSQEVRRVCRSYIRSAMEYPDCILICDEIGNGIVPMEAEERTYRECTGRILEGLAAQADEVVRVVCGIGQKIK